MEEFKDLVIFGGMFLDVIKDGLVYIHPPTRNTTFLFQQKSIKQFIRMKKENHWSSPLP